MVKLVFLLITIVYSASCTCLGMVIITSFHPLKDLGQKQTQLTFVATSFLFGQGLLANIWIILGLFGVFTPGLIWLICILLISASFLRFRTIYINPGRNILLLIKRFRDQTIAWRFIFIMLVLLGGLLAIKAITLPPSGDAEAFYMVFPKIMADSHRLVPQPNYYSFSQIGLSGEMHYAALISLASPYAAKFYVWITALALAAMLLAICSAVGCTLKGKITALVILLTSTTVTAYIYDGKVDLFGAAFGLAAYYWILQTRSTPGRFPYIMTGIFLSFAMVAKFSNIPVIVPGIVLILVWNVAFGREGFKESAVNFSKGLLIIVFFTVCFLIPHLTKNYVLFKEPFAPFFFFKADGNRWIEQAWFSSETTKFILETYPLALVFGRYPMQGGTLSPLIFAFIPLFLVLPERNVFKERQLLQIIVVSLLGVGIWMILRPSVLAPRYILATLLLFIPISAWVVEKLFSVERRFLILKFSVILSMFIFLMLTCVMMGVRSSLAAAYHWFNNKSYDYEASGGLKYINAHTQPGDRIFFIGYYTYYLRSDLLQCINNEEERDMSDIDLEYLFEHGYKYYVRDKNINTGTKEYFHSNNDKSWLSAMKVFDDDNYIIYSIFSNDSLKIPDYVCEQCEPPAWAVIKAKSKSFDYN